MPIRNAFCTEAALVSRTNGFQRSFRFPSLKMDYAGERHSSKNGSSSLMWRQTQNGPMNIGRLRFGTVYGLRGLSRSLRRMTKCLALSHSIHMNCEFQPKRTLLSFKAQDTSLESQSNGNGHRNLSQQLWRK